MLERIKNEPVLVSTLLGTILVLLVQFGVPLTDAQANAITGVVVAGLALFARRKVTPVE